MATLCGVLANPEVGWRRYDDRDSNILFTDLSGQYCGVYAYVTQFKNGECKFNFTGNKLRIITEMNANNVWFSKNVEVTIDSINVIMFPQPVGAGYPVLAFHIENLSNSEHSVSIKILDNLILAMDAVDIDVSSTLLPYNKIESSGFLIRCNDSYYSLNNEWYLNGVYLQLPIFGDPTLNDLKQFGFSNVSDLTKLITLEEDTFKPIDKFIGKITIFNNK